LDDIAAGDVLAIADDVAAGDQHVGDAWGGGGENQGVEDCIVLAPS
jgi:hypothetical protein